MKKILFQLGILVSAIASIAPAVSAQSIKNGDYYNAYPDSYGIQVRNNKFTVVYDDPSPSTSVPQAGFKFIKSGVFLDKNYNKYYCLVTSQMEKQRRLFVCSKNGWKRR